MNKELIKRYVLLCLPFVCGVVLYSAGVVNIISLLLLFGGGYVAIKNLCDYRKIKKNIKLVADIDKMKIEKVDNNNNNSYDKIDSNVLVDEISIGNNVNKYRSYDSVPGLKSTRRYIKVRRRIR